MSDNTDQIKTHHLDARHLLCPMPVIKVQEFIEKMSDKGKGEHLAVTCTDPGTLYDIPAWSKIHGHKLIDKYEKNDEYHILIEICSDGS